MKSLFMVLLARGKTGGKTSQKNSLKKCFRETPPAPHTSTSAPRPMSQLKASSTLKLGQLSLISPGDSVTLHVFFIYYCFLLFYNTACT